MIQLFKAQKTEILKGIQRKTLIDTECENNINTGAEELVSSENVL